MVPGVGGSTDYYGKDQSGKRIIAGLPLAGGATNVHLREQGPQGYLPKHG